MSFGHTPGMAAEGNQDIYSEFKDQVNMTRGELVDWLKTEESQSVGYAPDGGEAVGHEMGRQIVDILQKKKTDLDDEDYAHMRKVLGYLSRHLAQRPDGDVTETRWRYSLMNSGHDPEQ